VKLCGYNKGPVKVQCFIGHDKQIGSSHLFYQASKITGKNSTRCITKKIDGTTVIVMDACPENDMQVTVDCVGILKVFFHKNAKNSNLSPNAFYSIGT